MWSASLPHWTSLTFKSGSLEELSELGAEVSLFLKERENPLLEDVERIFIHGLTYLADIINHVNKIGLSVQGPEVTITDAT
jgi:hypothetical protein